MMLQLSCESRVDLFCFLRASVIYKTGESLRANNIEDQSPRPAMRPVCFAGGATMRHR
jgi:hypothetical protein